MATRPSRIKTISIVVAIAAVLAVLAAAALILIEPGSTEQRIEALRESGDNNEALLDYLIVLDRTNDGQDLERKQEIAELAYQLGRIDTAVNAAREILTVEPENMAALNELAKVELLHDRLDQARSIWEKVVAIAESESDRSWIARATGNLGLIYRRRGDLDEAEKMHLKAMEINEELGLRKDMAVQYSNLGAIYQTRGDLDEAEKMLRKALEIDKELGQREGMAIRYVNLGLIYQTRGDVDEARRLGSEARKLYEEIGITHMVTTIDAWLADLPDAGD